MLQKLHCTAGAPTDRPTDHIKACRRKSTKILKPLEQLGGARIQQSVSQGGPETGKSGGGLRPALTVAHPAEVGAVPAGEEMFRQIKFVKLGIQKECPDWTNLTDVGLKLPIVMENIG